MTALLKLNSVTELLAFCEEAERTQSPVEAVRLMCGTYVDTKFTRWLAALDPFSAGYHELCLALYRELAGVSVYDPWENEKTPYIDLALSVTSPMPYQYRDSLTVSDFLLSWGWILRNLDVRGGASVLEYGAGEAQLSIHLARMGCDVAIVDIDQNYLDAVQAQCTSLGLTIELQKGQFGDAVRDRRFDRIIFFEAFHHALDHRAVLKKIKPLLTEDGFILFSGEPIVDPTSVFVPFAWGPRLDGLSVRSTRKFGWCELGFQRPYFTELLMRAGFLVTHSPCPVTGRGDCFMAKPTPLNTAIAIGKHYVLEIHGTDAGWHEGEGDHRWTTARALFTLPEAARLDGAVVQVANYLGVARHVVLRCGTLSSEVHLDPGQEATLRIKIASGQNRLEIAVPELSNSAAEHVTPEIRELGIAVKSIRLDGQPS